MRPRRYHVPSDLELRPSPKVGAASLTRKSNYIRNEEKSMEAYTSDFKVSQDVKHFNNDFWFINMRSFVE